MFVVRVVKNLLGYLNMYKKQGTVSQTITTTISRINEKTFIPPKLSIEDVCELAKKYFDDLSGEELKKLFEKFNVNGKALVKASANNDHLQDLKKKLGLIGKRNVECFDKMVDVVRQRQEELNKNLAEQSEENTAGPSKDSEETTKERRTVAVKLRKQEQSTTKLGNIKVDKKGSDKYGTVGIDVDTTDSAKLTTGNIEVIVDTTDSSRKRPAPRKQSQIKKRRFN